MRRLTLALVLCLVACSQGMPTVPSSGTPQEEYVLSETERYASLLHVHVTGALSNVDYLVPRPQGGYLRALGWYDKGTAYYWRPWVIGQSQYDNSFPALSCTAAHEVCHAIEYGHDAKHVACIVSVAGIGCSYPLEDERAATVR